jgi:hypothetical protein
MHIPNRELSAREQRPGMSVSAFIDHAQAVEVRRRPRSRAGALLPTGGALSTYEEWLHRHLGRRRLERAPRRADRRRRQAWPPRSSATDWPTARTHPPPTDWTELDAARSSGPSGSPPWLARASQHAGRRRPDAISTRTPAGAVTRTPHMLKHGPGRARTLLIDPLPTGSGRVSTYEDMQRFDRHLATARTSTTVWPPVPTTATPNTARTRNPPRRAGAARRRAHGGLPVKTANAARAARHPRQRLGRRDGRLCAAVRQ